MACMPMGKPFLGIGNWETNRRQTCHVARSDEAHDLNSCGQVRVAVG